MTALFTVYYLGFVFGWAPIYHILTSEIPSSRTLVHFLLSSLSSLLLLYTRLSPPSVALPYSIFERLC